MLTIFRKWYDRYLFEEESVLLLVLIGVTLFLMMALGAVMAPIVAAMILAYLVQGVSSRMQGMGLPKWMGFGAAYGLFVAVFFGSILGLFPLVWRQLVTLATELPRMVKQVQAALSVLPEKYPQFISEQQIVDLVASVQRELAPAGQKLLELSLNSLPGLFGVMIYLILIPLLVFFFLKDKDVITRWLSGQLPKERPLLRRIWAEMDLQIANYARGKAIEVLIVGSVSYLAFLTLGLNYAALLGLLVGLSVIIPYVGATLVTIPVVLVAFFQWGIGNEFYTVVAVYLVIQILDGNVLVPLLFSEAVNLHPVAIILAVLFFGGIWGLWGAFFAIPLATLIKAIMNAWPVPEAYEPITSDSTGETL